MERDWATPVQACRQGSSHVGDMDNFYLNAAFYLT
jgi:hypothetical protein